MADPGQQVFHTAELLEIIIIYTEIKDIFRLRQVNPFLRNFIARTPALRRRCFLELVPLSSSRPQSQRESFNEPEDEEPTENISSCPVEQVLHPALLSLKEKLGCLLVSSPTGNVKSLEILVFVDTFRESTNENESDAVVHLPDLVKHLIPLFGEGGKLDLSNVGTFQQTETGKRCVLKWKRRPLTHPPCNQVKLYGGLRSIKGRGVDFDGEGSRHGVTVHDFVRYVLYFAIFLLHEYRNDPDKMELVRSLDKPIRQLLRWWCVD
ncbi:hypothetical protein BS50DRAFT_587787 [Corynespora cassiicola Philippines]|uniref:F-box domain-containing protein n=1 Tax=Corynespora cassiicola Philippines TaxID=1448308 RepID=A0A2T2NMV3_CORCC|nr:hypothetical protein BS50DRAFT_587787 [Corynespora cassiicola Philippines]